MGRDHPFSQSNKTTERTVGVGIKGDREVCVCCVCVCVCVCARAHARVGVWGGAWTNFEKRVVVNIDGGSWFANYVKRL